MPARRIIVTGTVQGVFFRATARMQAKMLGLAGRVWNNPDGSVEIFAEGSQDSLACFIDWCRIGPPAARVDRVIVEETQERGEMEFVSERGS